LLAPQVGTANGGAGSSPGPQVLERQRDEQNGWAFHSPPKAGADLQPLLSASSSVDVV